MRLCAVDDDRVIFFFLTALDPRRGVPATEGMKLTPKRDKPTLSISSWNRMWNIEVEENGVACV